MGYDVISWVQETRHILFHCLLSKTVRKVNNRRCSVQTTARCYRVLGRIEGHVPCLSLGLQAGNETNTIQKKKTRWNTDEGSPLTKCCYVANSFLWNADEVTPARHDFATAQLRSLHVSTRGSNICVVKCYSISLSLDKRLS